jgi:dihydroflavonol-4-reductase
MKAVVTGATGLIGRQVCARAQAAGWDVRAAVRPSTFARELPYSKGYISLRDAASLTAAFEGADVVIHAAGLHAYGSSGHEGLEAVNVDGTRLVIAAAAAAGVRRVVVTSSAITSGSSEEPLVRDEDSGGWGDAEKGLPYFVSKIRQELVAFEAGEDHGVEVVAACPTVVLGGPSGRLVPSNAILSRYLLDPLRTTFPGGCNVVSVGDVAAALLLLAEHGTPGERYIVGGENLLWHTLHSTLAELAGVSAPRAEVPTRAAWLASFVAEGWAKVASTQPMVTREEAMTVGRFYWYRHDRIGALGYEPGTGRAAIAQGLAWLLADGHLPRWIKESLKPLPEVRAARPLVPRQI